MDVLRHQRVDDGCGVRHLDSPDDDQQMRGNKNEN